ncbi:MAG TPA: hypothetical protein VIO94_16370, partial [Phenylobacterium sp.]
MNTFDTFGSEQSDITAQRPGQSGAGDLSLREAGQVGLAGRRLIAEDAALEHLGRSIVTEALDVICDTALEDHLALIVEGLIGGLHSAALRLERQADRGRDELRRGMRDFDGSEVADTDLQDLTATVQSADEAARAVERARDAARQAYTAAT